MDISFLSEKVLTQTRHRVTHYQLFTTTNENQYRILVKFHFIQKRRLIVQRKTKI